MSTFYLLDQHANPVSSATIRDVSYPEDGRVLMNGSFVVRVEDGLAVRKPTTMADLLTQKHASYLAITPGYTAVAFDDLLDSTGIDVANSTKVTLGERGQVSLYPTGSIRTIAATLGSTPTQAVLYYEVYEVEDADPAAGRMTRTYHELTPSLYTTAQVSFNGWATQMSATNGGLLNIAVPDEGTSFILKITNTDPSKRIRLGSWTLCY